MKTLITYCYYEKPSSRENLLFFLKNGYIDNPNYHFLIISNSGDTGFEDMCRHNLQFFNRQNEGFDFGAWGYGLKLVNLNNYNMFIFLNSTCIGPFIFRFIPKNLTWVDLFNSRIDGEYKLCGPTINYLTNNKISDQPHIQSFAFGTDKIGLNILLENNIFNPSNNIIRRDLIINHEIGMSKTIMSKGYKLFSFQLSENSNKEHLRIHDDIHYNNKYFNDTINPLEVMFVKSERINTITLENYKRFLS
jgi:lipopolysaccharide biosynthesis protein